MAGVAAGIGGTTRARWPELVNARWRVPDE
jgi:hypothetical protein